MRISTVALLTIVVAAFAALASGAAWLEASLPGGLPMGNALTALALCALPGIAVQLSARGSAVRNIALAALLLAVAWLPVSIALAGNLELSFGGRRGAAWLVLTLGSLLASAACLAWALVVRLLARVQRAGAT